jgi:hypothetical protein
MGQSAGVFSEVCILDGGCLDPSRKEVGKQKRCGEIYGEFGVVVGSVGFEHCV